MHLNLVRIDDRLIHGQVATVWSKESKCNRIIIVSDEVVKDELRKTMLKQVAPPGIKSHVVSVKKMIEIYKDPRFNEFKVLALFTNPTEALRVIQGGVEIKSINIGGMSFQKGKTQITSAVSVDENDINAFRELDKLGIELEIRKIAKDSKINLMTKI